MHDVLTTAGRPLEAAVRAVMESRFGQDFSRVRVHTGAKAAESARAVDAAAYTFGQEIVFGAGRYALGTAQGDRLLAHELTHTIQQSGGVDAAAAPRGLSDPRDVAETEAAAADAAVAHEQALAISPWHPARLARQAAGGGGAPTDPRSESVRQQMTCIAGHRGCPGPSSKPSTSEIALYNSWCRGQTGYAGPDVTPTSDICAAAPMQWKELELARNLEREFPGWLARLEQDLPCPCFDKDAAADPAKWNGPGGCRPAEHPGAVTGYRSVPTVSSKAGTKHGQQCCYDEKGKLITRGAAAGTPDIVSPGITTAEEFVGRPFEKWWGTASDVAEHNKWDVKTFESLKWQRYALYWRPSPGRGKDGRPCDPNPP